MRDYLQKCIRIQECFFSSVQDFINKKKAYLYRRIWCVFKCPQVGKAKKIFV